MTQVTITWFINKPLSTMMKYISIISALLFCLLTTANMALAQGVGAGSIINNIATVTYTVNEVAQEPINSSPTGNTRSGRNNGAVTNFVVDRKVDLLVTGNTNANVNPGDAQAEVNFTLQNQGNDTQEFSLIVDNLLATDNFDTNSCNVEVTGVTGTPVAGVTLPTSGNIKLKADQQASVSVKCDIPLDNNGAPIRSGQTALVGLIATVEKNSDNTATVQSNTTDTSQSVDTVFADGAGSDDGQSDGMHSDRRTFIASTGTLPPTLTMDKTIVSVVDPAGGSTAITGSEVTYKIQINTNGVGTINNVVITDPTPADMTYKGSSVRLNNSPQSDADDALDRTDFGATTADTVTVNIGDVAAGTQHEIQLTYIIN